MQVPFLAYYPDVAPFLSSSSGSSYGGYTFAPQLLGTTSAAVTLTVFNGNAGGPPDHPVSVSASKTGAFVFPGGTTCAASQTMVCTLPILFSPSTAGTVTETFVATDQTSGNTGSFTLTGTAGTRSLSLSPNALTFPSRAVGTTSIPMIATLTKTGTLAATVSSITLSGAANNNFTQTNNCAGLASQASCTINVTFAPTVSGSQSATVQIVSDAPSSPTVLSLSGTAQ